MSVGASTLWSILQNEFKMTRKKLERRARHVRDSNILRFVRKLASIKRCKTNIIFLDEVSFDNRGMLHCVGYGPKGKPLIFRGEYNRMPSVSLLVPKLSEFLRGHPSCSPSSTLPIAARIQKEMAKALRIRDSQRHQDLCTLHSFQERQSLSKALRTFIPMLPTERTLAKEWLKMVQTSGLAAWEPDVIIIKGKKYSVEDMDVAVEAAETLNETIHIIENEPNDADPAPLPHLSHLLYSLHSSRSSSSSLLSSSRKPPASSKSSNSMQSRERSAAPTASKSQMMVVHCHPTKASEMPEDLYGRAPTLKQRLSRKWPASPPPTPQAKDLFEIGAANPASSNNLPITFNACDDLVVNPCKGHGLVFHRQAAKSQSERS